MAANPGNTYDVTGGVRMLEVENLVYLLTPHDVPFQGTFNSPNAETPPFGRANSILSHSDTNLVKYEWIEDELLPPRTTAAEAMDGSETGLDVATGTGKYFEVGDVVRMDDELMRITGISTDTLTVTRGFGDSVAATHLNGADVVGTGMALAEGSDPANGRYVDRSGLYNVTQIFGPTEVEQSGTQQSVSQYGVSNELMYQVGKRMPELAIAYEQAIIYGQREQDTTNKWRTMGGFFHYIVTNKDTTTTTLDEPALNDQLQGAYNNGGVIDLIAAGGRQKRNISAFSSGIIRLDRGDRTRGQVVETYESDFGRVDILLNRHMRTSDLVGVTKKYISLVTLRPWSVTPLAKTGDTERVMLLGEKGMKVRLQKRHCVFNALT